MEKKKFTSKILEIGYLKKKNKKKKNPTFTNSVYLYLKSFNLKKK